MSVLTNQNFILDNEDTSSIKKYFAKKFSSPAQVLLFKHFQHLHLVFWKTYLGKLVFLKFKKTVSFLVERGAVKKDTCSLVIYLIIKIKEIAKSACKLIFTLSTMDLLTALISQTSYIAMLYEDDCNIVVGCKIADEYLGRLAGYTIGVTGIVRHIRIKYKMTYKSILTSKGLDIFVMTITCIAFIQTILQRYIYFQIHRKFSNSLLCPDSGFDTH